MEQRNFSSLRMRIAEHRWTQLWISILKAFWPARQPVDARERWRSLLGAGIGVLLTAVLCRGWTGVPYASVPWIVAPLGASAVLVFALPASPLAQPWAVVGGNTLSTLVGVACAMFIPDPAYAGAVAVAIAIGLMFWLRCLHPPGGAAALLSALGGVSAHFALFPVLANCVVMVVVGMAYNTLTGRRYPHVTAVQSAGGQRTGRFSSADLDTALAHYNQVLDISRDDLEGLMQSAEAAAYERRFGDLTCRDIMSTDLVSVQYGTRLDEAWNLMQERRIKALPVTDRVRRIVGIVTVADFMRNAGLKQHTGLAARLRDLVRPSGLVNSFKPEVVGQLMTREVRVISLGRQVSELIPLFSEAGHHHIPVIDADNRLVGIITQSDLVRALYRAVSA